MGGNQPVMVEAVADFKWNLDNNCGPRPQGPMYPAPPMNGTGVPHNQLHCDIIVNATYITGYRCNTTCQLDDSIDVQLMCDCHINNGLFLMPKDCEWAFIGETSCPTVTTDQQYDWECDPRQVECSHEQYPSLYTTTTTTTTTTATTTTTTTATISPVYSTGPIPLQYLPPTYQNQPPYIQYPAYPLPSAYQQPPVYPLVSPYQYSNQFQQPPPQNRPQPPPQQPPQPPVRNVAPSTGGMVINFNPILSNNVEDISSNSSEDDADDMYFNDPLDAANREYLEYSPQFYHQHRHPQKYLYNHRLHHVHHKHRQYEFDHYRQRQQNHQRLEDDYRIDLTLYEDEEM